MCTLSVHITSTLVVVVVKRYVHYVYTMLVVMYYMLMYINMLLLVWGNLLLCYCWCNSVTQWSCTLLDPFWYCLRLNWLHYYMYPTREHTIRRVSLTCFNTSFWIHFEAGIVLFWGVFGGPLFYCMS